MHSGATVTTVPSQPTASSNSVRAEEEGAGPQKEEGCPPWERQAWSPYENTICGFKIAFKVLISKSSISLTRNSSVEKQVSTIFTVKDGRKSSETLVSHSNDSQLCWEEHCPQDVPFGRPVGVSCHGQEALCKWD